jgi:hypothetical protein
VVLYFVRKTLVRAGVGAALCLLVGLFSAGGRLYSGFASAFLGAAFLLAAWLKLPRPGGGGILGRLWSEKAPGVPYFHQKDKDGRAGIFPGRRGERDPGERPFGGDRQQGDGRAEGRRQRCDAAAWAVCGAAFLLASLAV